MIYSQINLLNIYYFNLIDPGGKLTVTSDRTLGFSTVTVKNSTHLVFEHILSDNNFQVFDTFTIYKPLPQ